jgi:rhamnose utilization protein RhaD (predicted bifunctional aldolase and dehydrogenase)
LKTSDFAETTRALVDLSRGLGAEHRGLAILGEGNASARISDETFIVKASGSSLGTLTEEDVTECRFAPLLAMLDRDDLSDKDVDDELFACRVHPSAKKPSVEALFHAYLLSLPDVNFVGHTHPVHVNQILCSPRARELVAKKLFPDDIVCCGPASVFVPYTDPGLKLSQVIRSETEQFIEDFGIQPRVILLENHGIITLGRSPDAVKAAMFMSEKAARIFIGAATLGGPHFLSEQDVSRIGGRPDEHYRQKVLKL